MNYLLEIDHMGWFSTATLMYVYKHKLVIEVI